MQDLGTLGGTYSYANAINASGQVVGWASTGPEHHAFLYSDGAMQDLGTLGGIYSYAKAINASGQVVGWSTGLGPEHAFIYSEGLMTDLNTFLPANSGWTLLRANAINDSGQIVGYGDSPYGDKRAYLLTPIPEPATLGLMLLGGLAAVRRRKSDSW